MTASACDLLPGLLAGAGGRQAFGTSLTAPVGDLLLAVDEVGLIELPVSPTQARALCLVGREARYGQGEKTIVDRAVRDTWEIPISAVTIDAVAWDRTLRPVLERVGRGLGLPPGRALTADLHSMLVYAPGQFFVQHQDSEKDDAMVASLVVSLPSTFSGGALAVRHGGRTATYRGSKTALSFVAFYSDCRHEVRPVTSGYRVVLTYNLMLAGDAVAAAPDPELVAGASRCLSEHFETADRLVYLLDHEYTRRGLDWARLKGADADPAGVLAGAAERAGCEVALCLAEVHETWTTSENDRYGGHWDDEPEGGDVDLEELIDWSTTLDGWVEPAGARLATIGLRVSDHEICSTTPSGELEPHRSEYEGFMGNWGNTLDRWYRRGAVLVWPASRGFALRAEASPSWALDELAARARDGDVSGARAAAGELAGFWDRVGAADQGKGILGKALRAARAVDDATLATLLLAPFALERVAPNHARALSALTATYGERWAGDLVVAWTTAWRLPHHTGPEAWIAESEPLVRALDAAFATLVIAAAWRRLSAGLQQALPTASPTHREQALAALAPALAAVLEGAALVGETPVRDAVLAVLRGDGDIGICATAVLKASPPERWNATGLAHVALHRVDVLTARLSRPPRAGDDWSTTLPRGCACELCQRLRAFLANPAETQLDWPLAKPGRRHVHSRIDQAELPVRHATRRVGRPYTLVLAKTDDLFKREQQRRLRDEQDLIWLELGLRA